MTSGRCRPAALPPPSRKSKSVRSAMTTHRASSIASTLIAVAVGICLIATGTLIAFPGNQAVWQVAAWTLTLGLAALVVLVPFMAYLLTTRRARRTWPQVASFGVGLACLAVVAIGSL